MISSTSASASSNSTSLATVERSLSHSELNQIRIVSSNIENYNFNKKTRAVHFPHHEPLLCDKNKYFLQDKIDYTRGVLPIVISIYNEELIELNATLHDLWIQSNTINKILEIHICIIMDGWNKASNSVKKWLKSIYPVTAINHFENENDRIPGFVPNWNNLTEEWNFDTFNNVSPVDTLILQSQNESCIESVTFDAATPLRKLKITTIVKRDNRRKHNSHQYCSNYWCL